jgi:hypothetical protein
MEQEPGRPTLPDLHKFQRQFEMKYGRQMTPEERRWFTLAEDLLKNPPEEEQGKAAD